MALTPYTPTTWVNDSEPDIDDDNLNKIEQGIKNAIDGVNGILNALSSQIENEPAKFASSAALYAVNGSLNTVSSNLSALQGTVNTLNSNLTTLNTVTNGTVTRNTYNTTASYSRLYKLGKLAILNMDLYVNGGLTAYSEYDLGYIPEGYRPTTDVIINVSDGVTLHSVTITSAGTIKIKVGNVNSATFALRSSIAFVTST